MIERVKAAMLATETDVTMWDDGPLTRLALAAIEAMREPTDAMWEAGLQAEANPAEGIWQVMIDAALKETAE